jgi:gliding motility-associated-like protein
LVIYDRWGEKIFETLDREDCWNGRFRDQDVVPGVYVYLIEYDLQHCGRIKKVQKYGDVTVMY